MYLLLESATVSPLLAQENSHALLFLPQIVQDFKSCPQTLEVGPPLAPHASVGGMSRRPALAGVYDPDQFSVGSIPAGVAVGDFNVDGRDDMAVVNSGSPTSVSVLLANADGGFAPKVDYSVVAGALDATAGDMNGDGKLDLVVVGSALDILLVTATAPSELRWSSLSLCPLTQ